MRNIAGYETSLVIHRLRWLNIAHLKDIDKSMTE